jgi:hypothetical protein
MSTCLSSIATSTLLAAGTPVRQSFVGRTWDAERLEFAEALCWLRKAVPEAESSQERDEMNSLLKLWAIEAARTFHATYHRRFGGKRCKEFSVDLTLGAWNGATLDPCGRLASWTTAFLSAFNGTHPPCPCERAAAILRAFQDAAIRRRTRR